MLIPAKRLIVFYLVRVLKYQLYDFEGKNKTRLKCFETFIITIVFTLSIIMAISSDYSLFSFFLMFIVALKTLIKEIDKVIIVDNKTGDIFTSKVHWKFCIVYIFITVLFYTGLVIYFTRKQSFDSFLNPEFSIIIFIHYCLNYIIEITEVFASLFRGEPIKKLFSKGEKN